MLSLFIGLCIGSFLNVVVVRLPQKKSVVKPRSHCPHCCHPLTWTENVPLLSYLMLRGKCRWCQHPILVRYCVIELLTAILFYASEKRFGHSWGLWLRDWPFLAILIAITFIDLEHRIIPDFLSLGGWIWAFLTVGLTTHGSLFAALCGSILGFSIFYILAWGYQKTSGRSGLGGGDIKLLGMLGAFLGPSGVLTVVLVSSLSGSLFGLLWGWLTRSQNVLRLAIPYGPFLVLGALYYYLFGDRVWLPFTVLI